MSKSIEKVAVNYVEPIDSLDFIKAHTHPTTNMVWKTKEEVRSMYGQSDTTEDDVTAEPYVTPIREGKLT